MQSEHPERHAADATALAGLSDAVANLRMMVDRVLGTGDGSSWLDQLGATETLGDWSIQDVDKAAMMLRAIAERIRQTREVIGFPGDPQPFELPNVNAGPTLRADARLPMNRKERYFTGTVLPMVVASDGFLHLPRFLRLCGLDLSPDETWQQSGSVAVSHGWVQFFSEYSFAESVFTGQDRARFETRPQHADTPDIVLKGEDWLVAVEAKMFHRPSATALNRQMDRQRVLVDYWSRTFDLPLERVAHVLLLPEDLHRDRAGVTGRVITWEQVAQDFQGVAPDHWLSVLREALHRYRQLASNDNDVSDAHLTGQAIVDGDQNGNLPYAAAGRRGGLDGGELFKDLAQGTWRTQTYQVRIHPEPPNKNWFRIRDFVDRALAASVPAPPSEPAPTPKPVILHDADGLYVTASRNFEGAIVIQGQDLAAGGDIAEYEYALTIAREDVPTLHAALGGAADADTLDLLVGRAKDIIGEGEATWLGRHQTHFDFWSRVEGDD